MMGVDDAIAAGATLVDTVVKRIWPDPTEAEKGKVELLKMQMQAEMGQMLGQLDVDKAEAASASVFVAGWRPFIGWVCGAGLAYQWVFRPLISGALVAFGMPILPALDIGDLITLLLGMLGMGSLRTYEKLNNVHRSALK